MSEAIIIAFVTVIGTIMVALISRRNKKLDAADLEQDKLVRTLQDLVKAQDEKIQNLEELIASSTEEIRLLRLQIAELREVIVSQAVIIQDYSNKMDGQAP